MASAGPPSAIASDLPLFRIVRDAVAGGGELLTVFGRIDPTAPFGEHSRGGDEMPLVSVLRDTLGDEDPANDRLRYVWVHGYTRPSTTQRLASAVPFLNRRAGNKTPGGSASMPPSVIDLGAPTRELWRSALWTAAQYGLFFDPYSIAVKTSVRAFRRNDDDYRSAQVMRGMAILALYEADTKTTQVLTPVEMRDVQARFVLAQKALGGLIDDVYLQKVHEKEITSSLDVRGHNWELLRQRAEAEGLYFDPLAMPDGSATHALVWVARADLERTREFESRFLNIKSPWGDKRLLQWKGFTETRHFDADGRATTPDAENARAVELIPLALYGLDHPKIPVLLVDFRDHSNPKRRELTRRLLNDVTRNLLSLSPFGDLDYYIGQSVYNFVTGRRGMDINQPSRLRSYSQLKLLLSLDATLDPALAQETTRLLERVSMNPLQNDLDVEMILVQQSHAALLAARGSGGALQKLMERDRRREFTRLEHGATARTFLVAASIATAGLYRHRESEPPAVQQQRLDVTRRLTFHHRFLKEAVAGSPLVEVTTDIADVRRALQFIMDHGKPTDQATARVAERLFAQTDDGQTRRLAIACLEQLGSEPARRALLAIYSNPETAPEFRALAGNALGAPQAKVAVRGDAATLAQAGSH